jgi:hypothetical protein
VRSGTGVVRRGRCVGVERRHVSASGRETGQPIGGGACVIGVAVPTTGTSAAKGFISSRQETRESGGASGAVDEGLRGGGVVAAGVGVEGRAEVVYR